MKRPTFTATLGKMFVLWLPAFGLGLLALCLSGFVNRPVWWAVALMFLPPLLYLLISFCEFNLHEGRFKEWRDTLSEGDVCYYRSAVGHNEPVQATLICVSDDRKMAQLAVKTTYCNFNIQRPIYSLYPTPEL